MVKAKLIKFLSEVYNFGVEICGNAARLANCCCGVNEEHRSNGGVTLSLGQWAGSLLLTELIPTNTTKMV